MICHAAKKAADIYHAGNRAGVILREGAVLYSGLTMQESELPVLAFRSTEVDGPNGLEKWAEWGLRAEDAIEFTGNAEAGWVDQFGLWRITFSRTGDMQTYSVGQVTTCDGTPEDNGDGTHTYWCRSIYPMDSVDKTGDLVVDTATLHKDPRNNPIIGITLAGVALFLPGGSYTMPDEAPSLQFDLINMGYTGAIVTATSDVDWRIEIPGVIQSGGYLQENRVYWPMYLIPDQWGNIVNPCDSYAFSGEWRNGAGVLTNLQRQFCRPIVTRLKP